MATIKGRLRQLEKTIDERNSQRPLWLYWPNDWRNPGIVAHGPDGEGLSEEQFARFREENEVDVLEVRYVDDWRKDLMEGENE